MPRGRADPVVKERLEALEDRMPKLHSPWKRQVKYWKFQNHRKGFGQGFWIVLDRSFTRIHFSYCRGCLLIYCCCVYSQIWFILDSTSLFPTCSVSVYSPDSSIRRSKFLTVGSFALPKRRSIRPDTCPTFCSQAQLQTMRVSLQKPVCSMVLVSQEHIGIKWNQE